MPPLAKAVCDSENQEVIHTFVAAVYSVYCICPCKGRDLYFVPVIFDSASIWAQPLFEPSLYIIQAFYTCILPSVSICYLSLQFWEHISPCFMLLLLHAHSLLQSLLPGEAVCQFRLGLYLRPNPSIKERLSWPLASIQTNTAADVAHVWWRGLSQCSLPISLISSSICNRSKRPGVRYIPAVCTCRSP